MERDKSLSRVSLEYMPKGKSRSTWDRKDEEYCADFYLVARRSLNGGEFQLFSYYYMLGADWKLCTRRLKVDRGTFFHSVYRLEQKLGQVYSQLKPYALYPLSEYFGTWHTVDDLRPCPPPARRMWSNVVPIRPVLKPAQTGKGERKVA